MWYLSNHELISYVTYCSLVLAGYAASCMLLKTKRPHVEYDGDGDARFLGSLGIARSANNSDPCRLHLASSQACSERCRYAFLLWLVSCADGAKTELVIGMYFLSHNSFADALIRAKERGVQVRVILHTSEDHSGMGEALLKLRQAYIPIRSMRTTLSQLMHLKMIVVDQEYVLYGSVNITTTALEFNSEEMVKLSNPRFVTMCSRYIEGVWDDMTENQEFFVRIRNISQETLKAKAKLKSQNFKMCDEGKW